MAQDRRPFRFVHTADLHLDSPLTSLALRDPALAEQVDDATRIALRRIVDLCIDEAVDALLVAGDLYDGTQNSMHTAAVLTAALRRLQAADIPVYMIRGNHDAESRMTEQLMLPDNVFVFDGRGGTRTLMDGSVAIHGVSFRHKHAPESLLPKFRPPLPDALNIGLLHTSLSGGGNEHATYAPCTLGELIDHGYDYWALGHIHKRVIHNDKPAIVMPGNPQGRDIGEDGSRSVSLVTLAPEGSATIEERVVASVRFERVRVSLDRVADWAAIPLIVERALQDTRDACPGVTLIVRIELVDGTPLAWRLERDGELVMSTLRETAAGLNDVWLEKLENHTVSVDSRTGFQDPESESIGADTLADIGRLIEQEVLQSPDFIERIDRDASALLRKLPAELRDVLGHDADSRSLALREFAAGGSAALLHRLDGDR